MDFSSFRILNAVLKRRSQPLLSPAGSAAPCQPLVTRSIKPPAVRFPCSLFKAQTTDVRRLCCLPIILDDPRVTFSAPIKRCKAPKRSAYSPFHSPSSARPF
jgi:hypothetical protein